MIHRRELDAIGSPGRKLPVRLVLTMLPACVALCAGVLAAVHAVALFRPVAIAPLEDVRAAILEPTGSAILWASVASFAGLVGILAIRRSRWFRTWPLQVVALLGLIAGLLVLPVGLYHRWNWNSPFGWEYMTMPALADGGIGPEAAVMAASTVILAPDGDGDARSLAIGSGAIIRADGNRAWVLTCSHVAMPWTSVSSRRIAADAPPVWVYFSDGRHRVGRVAWIAPAPLDAVVVRVEIENPPPAIPSRSDAHSVVRGDEIFCVANPFRAGWVAHRGSVVRREPKETPAGPYSLIYVDLPVQPGDSGSGLFLAAGPLIGLTTWRGEGSGGPVAIGLPSDAARGILEALDWSGVPGAPEEEDRDR